MADRPLPGSASLTIVVALTIGVAGCATSTAVAVARPAAFPRAPGHAALPPPVPMPDAPPDATEAVAASVVQTALALRGIAYRFGGEDPSTGLDCSGLVHYVYARHQVSMPRTVEDQFDVGEDIDLSEVRAGDLVFFSTIGPGATHVGVALGPGWPGEFVHAPGTGSVVRIDRWDSPYWRARIVGVRRVLG